MDTGMKTPEKGVPYSQRRLGREDTLSPRFGVPHGDAKNVLNEFIQTRLPEEVQPLVAGMFKDRSASWWDVTKFVGKHVSEETADLLRDLLITLKEKKQRGNSFAGLLEELLK
jgi:hypothetical protein